VVRPTGRDRLTFDLDQSIHWYHGTQVSEPQSIVIGTVHPDAVSAVKPSMKAMSNLLV
jgi:hypothetical protein